MTGDRHHEFQFRNSSTVGFGKPTGLDTSATWVEFLSSPGRLGL
ncbi:MAG: hypothetical protein RMZ69_18780 [Nostoc sp. ChiQUE01a]|nr:hypothetical protein [Nostoc sp. ChiQUE01a]